MHQFITSEHPDKNVSIEYLEEIEKNYHIQFPEVLRDYYLNHNFSDNHECCFIMYGEEFTLDCIIPQKYGTVPFEKEYGHVLNNKHLSDDYIPFAHDLEGERYCWHKDTGIVFYISHENAEHPIPICNSVVDFFDILNRCSEETIELPGYDPHIKKLGTSSKSVSNFGRPLNSPRTTLIVIIASVIAFFLIRFLFH